MMITTAAGILLGIALYSLKKHRSIDRCRNASPFTREVWLIALIVAALLASLQQTVANTLSSNTTFNTDTKDAPVKRRLQETREWKDLQALWALITTDDSKGLLRGDAQNTRMPEWKNTLLKMALDYRIKNLKPLVAEGLMTEKELHAVEQLVKDISWHLYRENSGAMCYRFLPPEYYSRNAIIDQAKLLKEQFAKGSLNKKTMMKTANKLCVHLEMLGVLDGYMNLEQYKDQMDAFARHLREENNDGEDEQSIAEQTMQTVRNVDLGVPDNQRLKARAWNEDPTPLIFQLIDSITMPNRKNWRSNWRKNCPEPLDSTGCNSPWTKYATGTLISLILSLGTMR